MKIFITSEQKIKLERLHDTTRDGQVRDRIKAILLASEGWSSVMIAQALRLHQTTVDRHISDYLNAQYKVIRKLGKNDELVELTLSPQARKKWANAPATLTARLLCKTIKNKIVYILTSMTDPQKYPKADIAELYGYHWEIEHGFREMKQNRLKNELTLRSKKPELIEQELWGVVLAYNLLRFMMTQMAYSQKGTEPYQIGFKQACLYLTGQLSLLPRVSPGKIPQFMSQLLDMSESFVLPVRRERHYPRAVKKKPQRYPLRHS
ncbi:transposase [Photorhabdus khanii]|uniref:Transposase n=1 Tax=Photorhabdus khanii TaxID=1004150 RepID=A0A7C9GKZ7_9GAMM|nr:transposase [Photorhabdus khanii]